MKYIAKRKTIRVDQRNTEDSSKQKVNGFSPQAMTSVENGKGNLAISKRDFIRLNYFICLNNLD